MSLAVYLQYGTTTTVTPDLGFGLLGVNVGVTLVTESIIIQPERNFGYYNKRFLAALNSGVITQTIYDTIINNQNETRQVFEVVADSDIDKQILIDLVNQYSIPNVDTGGTTAEIVEDILNEGYQIIKKL